MTNPPTSSANNGFAKAFVPGLVVGLVIGAVLGAVLPTFFESSPMPIRTAGAGDATDARREERALDPETEALLRQVAEEEAAKAAAELEAASQDAQGDG